MIDQVWTARWLEGARQAVGLRGSRALSGVRGFAARLCVFFFTAVNSLLPRPTEDRFWRGV